MPSHVPGGAPQRVHLILGPVYPTSSHLLVPLPYPCHILSPTVTEVSWSLHLGSEFNSQALGSLCWLMAKALLGFFLFCSFLNDLRYSDDSFLSLSHSSSVFLTDTVILNKFL